MANNVRNVLIFNTSTEKLNDILNAIKVDSEGIGSFDFNKILPMPPELKFDNEAFIKPGNHFFNDYCERAAIIERTIHSPRSNESEIAQAESEQNQLQEEIEKLSGFDKKLYDIGKRFNANIVKYGFGYDYEWSRANWGTKCAAYNFSHYDNTIEFLTANEIPEPIIKLLSEKYPDVAIDYQWADENFGYNLGAREYINGGIIYQHIPDAGTVAAYDMAFKIWHTTPQDCGYVLNPDGDGYISTEESATLSSFEFADEDNDELEL